MLRAQEAAIDLWHAEAPPAPSVTTFVACGALDVVIPAANAELLAERWQVRTPAPFEDCGHAFMAQVPEALAAQIKSTCPRQRRSVPAHPVGLEDSRP